MSALKYVVLCAVALSLRSVHGVTDEEKAKIKEAFLPSIRECSKEFGIEKEALLEAKAKGELGNLDPCFMACFYKKIGFMNEKGLFDMETALGKVSKYVAAEEDVKKAKEVGDDCLKVNAEAVGDGEKGCERAKIMFNCFHQHKDKFQF